MLTRRQILKLLAAIPIASPLLAADPPKIKGLGVCVYSYGIAKFKDALTFLTYCHDLGASGMQVALGSDPATSAKLRATAEKYEMYLEGQVSLPRADADIPKFEADLIAAKAAGADVVRAAALSGRRYETFESAEAFKQFAADSFKSLTRAAPILAKQKIRLALENHKDWRIPEMLDILTRISSPWVGICVDTGNSIALLEEPMSVVEAYAKFAFSCHLKDMGVQIYEDGFLLSEVPLGKGFLNLNGMINILRAANPQIRLNLEMITRDPLKIPCLTKRYRSVVEPVTDAELRAMLDLVRAKSSKVLPTTSGLSQAEKLKLEDDHVKECFDFAKVNS
jgi:sugar phosphate isomerase/epimerase